MIAPLKSVQALGWSGLALAIGLTIAAPDAAAAGTTEPGEPALSFVFDGQVEPMRTVTIANRVDGVIDEVLFEGGEAIGPGDPLFVIDPSDFEIAVERARAAVDLAAARLRLAEDAVAREAQLVERGAGARVRAFEATIEAEIARATLDEAQAALAAAELDLGRTRIAAPIGGHISRPLVARGAFVEAEAGTALAEIVQLDPVLVGYRVPYAARMEALVAASGGDVQAMFEGVTLALELPNGERYPHAGRPRFESAQIDPRTGTLTTWAAFPNPEGVLVPGLDVRVLSNVPRAEAVR